MHMFAVHNYTVRYILHGILYIVFNIFSLDLFDILLEFVLLGDLVSAPFQPYLLLVYYFVLINCFNLFMHI